MFCKWCGADFPNGARACKRCGKEIPPKSDCGGFYDLVPKAKAVPIPAAKDPAYQGTPPQAPTKEKAINANPVLILLCIILAVAVVLLLVTGNNSENEDSKRDRDSGSLLDGIIKDDDSTKPNEQKDEQPTETGEAVVPDEAKLVEQNIQFEIQVTEEGPEIIPELGDYTGTVAKGEPEYDKKSGLLTKLPILVNGEEAVSISINQKENEIEITVDDKLLEADEKLTYTWEVCVNASEEWDALKAEKEALTAVYEGKIEKLEQIAFRLTYKKAAAQDEEAEAVGSLTVSIPASLLKHKKAD